jgi:tetratricopeptide (TPR) repeat protein
MLLSMALLGDAEHLETLLQHLPAVPELAPVAEPAFEELEGFRASLRSRPMPMRDCLALTALTLAVEANRQRTDEDFRGAELSFLKAARFVEEGSYAPWLVARILDLRASLWIDIGAYRKAERDLRNARALGGGYSVHWKLGRLHQQQGEQTLAIGHFLEAQSQCPPGLLPKLKMNLAHCHAFLGQTAQARKLMDGVSFSDSGVDTAQATWIRGLIAKELDWPSFLPLLEAAHAMFGLIGHLQGTALTAIDIALEYAERGDFGKLRENAAAAYSILLGLGAEPQAIAAFSLMAKAQAATLDAIPMRQAIIRALSCRAVPS